MVCLYLIEVVANNTKYSPNGCLILIYHGTSRKKITVFANPSFCPLKNTNKSLSNSIRCYQILRPLGNLSMLWFETISDSTISMDPWESLGASQICCHVHPRFTLPRGYVVNHQCPKIIPLRPGDFGIEGWVGVASIMQLIANQ